jgi:hypothetical protein
MKRLLLPVAVAAALFPAAAEAHLVVTGLGPVYDGATHFGLSPEDFLPVLALALFTGLRGPRHARLALAALAASWMAGGLLTSAFGLTLPPILAPAMAAALLLATGGMLAANLELAPWPCAAAAAVLGLARGAADLSGTGPGGSAALNALGMAAAAAVLFALAASTTLPLRRLWMIVAARVAGSWAAAAGLLLAGWLVRYGAQVQ